MENVYSQLDVTAALLPVPTEQEVLVGPTTEQEVLVGPTTEQEVLVGPTTDQEVLVGPTTRPDALENRKTIFPPPGLEPRTAQPVA